MTETLAPYRASSRMQEAKTIDDHFQRILHLSAQDCYKKNERSRLKSALAGLEAYLADRIDDEYLHNKQEVFRGDDTTNAGEFRKSFRWMSELKRLTARSHLTPPRSISWDSKKAGVDEDEEDE